jgi:hypothetical protein
MALGNSLLADLLHFTVRQAPATAGQVELISI